MFNSRRLFLLCSRGFSSLKTPTKIEIIHSSIQNIHFNLATEEYLFDHCQLDHPILFLWRNDKTVVIGFSMNFLNENNEFFNFKFSHFHLLYLNYISFVYHKCSSKQKSINISYLLYIRHRHKLHLIYCKQLYLQ